MRLHTWSTTQWCPGAGRCSSTTHLRYQLTKVVYWSNLQHKYSSSECMGHSFWQNTFYTTTPDVAVDLLVQCIHCWHTATIRARDHYQSWLHPCFHWSDPRVLLWFRWYNRGNQQISKKDSSKLRNPAWTDNWNSLLQTVGLFFLFYLKDGV